MASFSVQKWREMVLLSMLVTSSIGEMMMKESRVDPFSLILDNQRLMIAKMDKMSYKLNRVNDLEKRLNSMKKQITESDQDFRSLQANFNSLNDKFSSLTEQLLVIGSSRREFEKEWRFAFHSLHTDVKDLFSVCNSSSSPSAEETEIVSKKLPREVTIVEIEKQVESVIKSAPMKLYIDSKINKSHEQIFRILSLLHNIEYRQHISSLAQDRRLANLLEKLGIHEKRIVIQIQNYIQHIKLQIEAKIDSSLTVRQERTDDDDALDLNATNIDAVDCVSNDTNCQPATTFSTTPSMKESSELPHHVETTISSIAESILEPLSELYNESSTEIPITTQDYQSSSSTIQEEETDDEQPVSEDPKGKENLNQTNSITVIHLDKNEKDDYKTVNEKVQPYQQQPMLLQNIGKLLDEQMTKLEATLYKRRSITEEKLHGIQIHQSTTLYTHAKELRYEMDKLKRGLSETMRMTNDKLSKRLDNVKRTIFTYIEGAVISISSSAVSSAHSSGMQVAKQLKLSMQQIETRLSKLESKDYVGCPEFYQRIGDTCLILLKDIETSWTDGCQICNAIGGTLLLAHKTNDVLLMKKLFLRNLKKEENYTIWLRTIDNGLCKDLKQETTEELTNSVVISEKLQNLTLNCPAVELQNINNVSIPCDSKLTIVCQYQLPSCRQGLFTNNLPHINDLDYT